MTSILEKLDDLIRGGLHRFVDRALEDSSLILFDQDVRDMEEAIAHVEEAAVTMYAAAQANERRLAGHQGEVERLEERLERLAAEGVAPTSERMMVAQAALEAKRGLVTETQAQIARQQAQYETLARQQAELKVRAGTLQDARPRLESLLVLARAYRGVERVELTLDALRGLGGDAEVALIADDIYRRFAEAQARQEMLHQASDVELLAELEQAGLDEQLAERRQRLGLEPEPVAERPPASETATSAPPPTAPSPDEPSPSPSAPLQ
jgi:phage shock protein A